MHNYKSWLVCSNKLWICWSLFLISTASQAVVNIDRTRVVFETGKSTTTFSLINDATERPALVQIWIDEGDPTLIPEQIKTPIVIDNPIFSLQPNEQRNIKLILANPSKLPTDRESIYWLNILQVPAQQRKQQNEQRILLPLRMRVKLFVRPNNIVVPTEKEMQRLTFNTTKNGFVIHNPTPWNITIIALKVDNQIFGDYMIAPFSDYGINSDQKMLENSRISFGVINDNGNQWSIIKVLK